MVRPPQGDHQLSVLVTLSAELSRSTKPGSVLVDKSDGGGHADRVSISRAVSVRPSGPGRVAALNQVWQPVRVSTASTHGVGDSRISEAPSRRASWVSRITQRRPAVSMAVTAETLITTGSLVAARPRERASASAGTLGPNSP